MGKDGKLLCVYRQGSMALKIFGKGKPMQTQNKLSLDSFNALTTVCGLLVILAMMPPVLAEDYLIQVKPPDQAASEPAADANVQAIAAPRISEKNTMVLFGNFESPISGLKDGFTAT